MCICASPREFHFLCSTSLEPNLSIPEVPIGPTVHTGSILNRLSSVIAVSGHRQRRRRVEAGHRCQAGAVVHGEVKRSTHLSSRCAASSSSRCWDSPSSMCLPPPTCSRASTRRDCSTTAGPARAAVDEYRRCVVRGYSGGGEAGMAAVVEQTSAQPHRAHK